MPISNIESHAGPYYPDGVVTDFPFAFDLVVTEGAPGVQVARIAEDGSSAIVDPGLYGVIPGEQGGTVRFAAAPAAGNPLFILATPSFKQLIAFNNQAPYLPEVVTDALDRAAARDIYMNGLLGRAILMPPGEAVGNAPVAADRAGMVLGFDDSGELLVSASYSNLLTAAANAAEDRRRAEEAAQQSVAATIGGRPIKRVFGDYTLADSDLSFIIRVDSDADSYVEFTPAMYRDGWYVDVAQYGVGAVRIKRADDVVVRSKNSYDELDLQFGAFNLVKISDAEGLAWGDLTALYVSPAVLVPSPHFDTFGTPAGTINGRSFEGGGLAWATSFWAGSNTDSLQVLSGFPGALSGAQGTNAQSTSGYVTTPTSNRKWITRKVDHVAPFASTSVATGLVWQDHVTVTAGSWSALSVQIANVSGLQGSFTIRAAAGGAALGSAYFITSTAVAIDGDTIEMHYGKSGSHDVVQFYLNGRAVGISYDISANLPTLPLSYKFGHRGSLANNGPIGYFEVADPDTQGTFRLEFPNRNQQVEADGSINLHLKGEVTLRRPANMQYRITNASGGTEIVPLTNIAGITWDNLNYSATINLPAPPSTGIILKVIRPDIDGGLSIERYGPAQIWPSLVFTFTGQSLSTYFTGQTSGGSVAAPANSFRYGATVATAEGANGGGALPEQRSIIPVLANTALAQLASTFNGITSNTLPFGFICGGKGATTAAERLPGTANNNAQRDGIAMAGGRFCLVFENSGQSDALGGAVDPATYAANLIAIYEDMMVQNGVEVPMILEQLSAIYSGTSDAQCEAIRRVRAQLCVDYPSRFKLGAATADLQHIISPSIDPYHLVDAAKIEQGRRRGFDGAKALGYVSYDRTGPKLLSVSTDSAVQCTVTCDLNGADGLSLLNAAYAGDYRGGLRFATDNSFASPLWPSGATIHSVVGTTQTISYTFDDPVLAGGHIFVSGPYGANPFNPSNSTTINGDMAEKASMLVGTYSGEPSIPIQPYYSNTGDYVHG